MTDVFEVEGHQEEPWLGSWDCCSGLTLGRRHVWPRSSRVLPLLAEQESAHPHPPARYAQVALAPLLRSCRTPPHQLLRGFPPAPEAQLGLLWGPLPPALGFRLPE